MTSAVPWGGWTGWVVSRKGATVFLFGKEKGYYILIDY